MQIGIDVDQDDKQIHPQQICNACNTKLLHHTGSASISAFQWSAHTEPKCIVCEHFHKHSDGGRPLQVARGRPPTAIESLQNSANPSWGDGQPLSLSRFISPSHSVLLSDLQCKKCANVVDRPVMKPCSHLLCCTCAVELLRQKGLCPACGSSHSAPPIPAGAVVCKVVGSLLLHCASCGCTVELQKIKEHLGSKCTQLLQPSPSKLTMTQIMARPADAPPSADERKLATALVRRMSNSSQSTSQVLSLPTAGQVRIVKEPHVQV